MKLLKNEFYNRYGSALVALAKTLKEENPDIILALSRKAPRLLELLRLYGLWIENIPIISERSLDFIPSQELKSKKILIFDDIVILGTTVSNILSSLITKYDSKLKFVCLAIDKDTIAVQHGMKNNDYWINLNNSDKVYLNYILPLSFNERFIFCNDIVRSFVELNKPYDIDYPIFYTSIDSNAIPSLLTMSQQYKSYSLTTIQQNKAGFYRYTFLPTFKSKVENLYNIIFCNDILHIEISKVRAFLNQNTGETTLASMVTFEMNSQLLEKQMFSDNFIIYEDLIRETMQQVDKKNETKAIYRLVWYIVSYFLGLFFIQRHPVFKDKLNYSLPSQILCQNDLFYIFGPSLTLNILEFLDKYYFETIQKLKEEIKISTVSNFEEEKKALTKNIDDTIFDSDREKLYQQIQPNLTAQIKAYRPLTDQMAAIFESLYYFLEVPTQEKVKRLGIKGNEYRRFNSGFTLPQIKYILRKHGVIQKTSTKTDMGISLALDFLIDAGIVIPIFYYERKDGFFERAYRYGEDALSARKYGYLIASAFKNLFDYIGTRNEKKILPRISVEKQGVVFNGEIIRTGLTDILENPIDLEDRTILISPSYGRHGKILLISDEAKEHLDNYTPQLFTEWCTEEKIFSNIPKEGLTYSEEHFNTLKFSGLYLPILIPIEYVQIFENLAILLYHVDRFIDNKKQSDFLIALTACDDQESYISALAEELRLFFKVKSYSFDLPVKKAIEYLKNNKNQTQSFIEEILKLLVKKSYSAANGIRHKKILWDKIPEIIEAIEKYFNETNRVLEPLYIQSLKFHIDRIKSVHNLPIEKSLKQFRYDIQSFGELCIFLSSILKNLLELNLRVYKKRMLKNGNVHKTDLIGLDNQVNNLQESIQNWNKSIYTLEIANVTFFSPINLLKLNGNSTSFNSLYNNGDCFNLLQDIIPEISKNYYKLKELYYKNFSLNAMRWKMKQFFPKGSDLELLGIKQCIEAARKCIPEDGRTHPKVGVAIIKDNQISCVAYRGELKSGEHAEYTALVRKNRDNDLSNATLITTLEPCTSRKHDKNPCADHIINRGISKVIIGMIDPNPEIRGKGVLYLQNRNIQVEFFPSEYQKQVKNINNEYWIENFKKYGIDLMKDLASESKSYYKEIENYINIENIQNSEEIIRIRTFETFRRYFSAEDLKVFCEIYLSIDYDELEGKSKSGKIADLIKGFEKENSLKKLFDVLQKYKPNILNEITNPNLT